MEVPQGAQTRVRFQILAQPLALRLLTMISINGIAITVSEPEDTAETGACAIHGATVLEAARDSTGTKLGTLSVCRTRTCFLGLHQDTVDHLR